jgi:hypothetical protein
MKWISRDPSHLPIQRSYQQTAAAWALLADRWNQRLLWLSPTLYVTPDLVNGGDLALNQGGRAGGATQCLNKLSSRKTHRILTDGRRCNRS